MDPQGPGSESRKVHLTNNFSGHGKAPQIGYVEQFHQHGSANESLADRKPSDTVQKQNQ